MNNKFRFRIPSTSPVEPILDMKDSTPQEWLVWWGKRYDYKEGDDAEYIDLIVKHKLFSAEDFREIGKWKDNGYAETRWKPNVASVAHLIWEQAAEELPKCPEESEVAAFLEDWSNRAYTDEFKSGPVTKHLGVSRASTLLHFLSGGRYPIFDSRVRAALSRLLDRPELPGTLGAYLNSCLPIFKDLADCCNTGDYRTLDKALFSYGALQEQIYSNLTASLFRKPDESFILPKSEHGADTNRRMSDASRQGASSGSDIRAAVRPLRIECSVYPLGLSAPEGLEAVELYVNREFERFIQKPKPRIERIAVTLLLPTGAYEGGLRTYPPDGSIYVCPDLRSVSAGCKISLAKVMKENGIEPRDKVEVLIDNGIWRIVAPSPRMR